MGTWILIAAVMLSFLFVFLGMTWISGFFDAFFRPEEPEDSQDNPPDSQDNPPAV